MTAPIIIFCYNRAAHLRRLINSLLLNKEAAESNLYIYADGARTPGDKDVEAVQQLIGEISGFKSVTITRRSQNIGLANNIIKGVSEVLDKHESAIVLEDDLIATPHLLRYMNEALDFYRDTNAWSIAGYTPNVDIPDGYASDTYPIMRNCSWGWATWRNRWQKVDWEVSDFKDFIRNSEQRNLFDESGSDLSAMLLKQQIGEIGSWSIRFCYSGFKHNMPTIYPTRSFIINGGADGSGSNVGYTSKYETKIFEEIDELKFCNDLSINPLILKSFRKTYNCSVIRRAINWWKRVVFLVVSR
ncbi:MAG: glycosyltransferase [Bacteroidales bacterium]|nr:glycosyltransferase [Bacteroidales bacterium]